MFVTFDPFHTDLVIANMTQIQFIHGFVYTVASKHLMDAPL